jgi:hypothetical protein
MYIESKWSGWFSSKYGSHPCNTYRKLGNGSKPYEAIGIPTSL